MRTIIHISDLHFGRTTPALVHRLREFIAAKAPNLVVASGDITQRAQRHEFQEAGDFFKSLACPVLVVPGNHDIPLFSLWKRFSYPYRSYHRHISQTLEPEHHDEEISVVGLNTVRTFKLTEGRISSPQLARLAATFANVAPKAVRIIVAHHPFYIPSTHRGHRVVGADEALTRFRGVGVDLLLSGHLHRTWTGHVEPLSTIQYRGPIMLQAGTTISTRLRNEPNTFNLLTIDEPRLEIQRYESTADRADFIPVLSEQFLRTDDGWSPQL